MAFVLRCRVGSVSGGGGDTFVHMESGRDLPIIYPENISHTQQAAHGWRQLKLALLSACHTASGCSGDTREERSFLSAPLSIHLTFLLRSGF